MESVKKQLDLVFGALLFVASGIYSYILLSESPSTDVWSTLAYVFFLVLVAAYWIWFAEEGSLKTLLIFTFCVHFGIIIGASISGYCYKDFWMPDSLSMHVPNSLSVTDYLLGINDWHEGENIFDRIFLSNSFVGIFFYLFGVGGLVSSFALMIIRLFGVWAFYQLGKELFNHKIGFIAALTYSLTPTVLFYSIVYYKEAAIQFFVAGAFLFMVRLFIQMKKLSIIPLLLFMYAVSNERFYLFPLLGVSLVTLSLTSKTLSPKLKYLSVAVAVVGIIGFFYIYRHNFPIQKMVNVIVVMKKKFGSYSDVNPINNNLPYPFLVLKFIFTPFFTLDKFKLFYNYSYLLTWGAIVNQFVMVTGLIVSVLNFKKLIGKYHFLFFPVAIYLGIFGYVAPYSGRIRDSFYCVYALAFAVGINLLLERFRRHKK